ncbi:MAG: PTS sugar transporter subunit IIC [Erysipelotrichaceae bacterium]|nr:PTS sugar transporter subunit IIC [Erysipelotrichaceae bacterium]
MSFIQAFLIGLFGYFGAKWSIPLWGDLGGWWTVGRPLVAGMIIGIILGDVKTGIILGCAINSLYLGSITVGGVAANDINFAAYIGIPLAMTSGATVEEALTLAALLGALGVFVWNFVKIINVYWVHLMDRQIAKGKLDLAANVPLYGNIFLFICRFFPIFFACLLGPEIMQSVMNAIPPQVSAIISIFGGMLPLIGFAIILKTCVKKYYELVYFVLGFVLFTSFNVSIIAILVVALVFALIDFKMGDSITKGGHAA